MNKEDLNYLLDKVKELITYAKTYEKAAFNFSSRVFRHLIRKTKKNLATTELVSFYEQLSKLLNTYDDFTEQFLEGVKKQIQ